MSIRTSRIKNERLSYFLICSFLILLCIIAIYPFWHVLMYSVSDSRESMTGGLFLLPRSISLLGFKALLNTQQIYVAYKNSILSTGVGVILSVLVTLMTAFALSQPRLRGRKIFTAMIYLTMLFSGGMIPTFLVVRSLGLTDTFGALFLPQLLTAFYVFVMRNALRAIPNSLSESAYIDGAGPFRTLFVIILPVAAPTVAAIAMFYLVRFWNSYKECLFYINTPKLQVLQIYLRNLMASASSMEMTNGFISSQEQNMLSEETLKMTAVAISVIPVLVIYPFLQRFYTKGMVSGAVKG